jgi:hypothetical protein
MVRSGDDLTPHLSLDPLTRGYTPASSAPSATPEERWSDKDMLLNVIGYHHFHLGNATRKHRSNELLFARITRTDFDAIAIFDHDVFTSGSSERMRLHAVHEHELGKGAPTGSAMLMSNISLSGTRLDFTNAAIDYFRLIREIDPLLDDPSQCDELRSKYGINVPMPRKLVWALNHLDLCLYDGSSHTRLLLGKGPTSGRTALVAPLLAATA